MAIAAMAAAPTRITTHAAVELNPAATRSSHSGVSVPIVRIAEAAMQANRYTTITIKMRARTAIGRSIRHRHGAQRQPFASGKLLGLTPELSASCEDVASP